MRHHVVVPGLVMLALALSDSGCSDPPTAPPVASTPSPAPSPAPIPAPTVTKLTITGSTPLTAIGQTSQLTATATFSDGTPKDVTTAAQWLSTTPSVVTVSSSGVVTVVSFGVSYIQAAFQSKQDFLQVTATPPNTFVFFGRVREPGKSGIAGVRILETQSGQSTLTDTDGNYSFGGLTTAHLTFEKTGFEAGQLDALPSQFNDMALQEIIRVTAGDSVTPLQLAPHDLSYIVGTDRCFPCRLIRVVTPAAGTLHLTLTWTETRETLNLWVGGQHVVGTLQQLTADVPVSAGEVVVYVGMILPPTAGGSNHYVPFKLATAMLGVTP